MRLKKSLSQIESDYASVFEKTINRKVPLNDDEHAALCFFVAAIDLPPEI